MKKSTRPARKSKTLKAKTEPAVGKSETVLQRCEQDVARRDFAAAANDLQAIASAFPFEDALLNGRYLRLLAFVEAQAGHLADAEYVSALGQLLFPQTLDFPFLLCSTKLRLKDYSGAIAAGERFVALRETMRGGRVETDTLNSTGGQVSDIHYWIGVAQKQSGDTDSACQSLQNAITADPGSQAPYLELAGLYQTRGRSDEALSVITRGLSACRDITELRLLAEAYKPHPTVSACMIVKDEEELLPECLASIRHWVDEIIVVDTGSSDQTVAIAKTFGARVFHQPWEGNFSRHRNYSLEQATGDWILIIDADERFFEGDIPAVRKLLDDPRHSAIAVSVYNVYDGEQKETFLPSIRLFRRTLNLRYDGIVHNTLVYPADLPIARANVRVNHLGYGLPEAKMRKKLSRTKELLRKQLEADPTHAFAWFNLAQALRGEAATFDEDTSAEVIEAAQKALSLSQLHDPATRHIHLMALDQLAWANFGRGAYEKALGYAQQAISGKPDYLDPLLLTGHVYAKQQRYAEAERAYQHYLKVQSRYDADRETENLILLHVDSRGTAYFALGAIAEMRGEFGRAIEYYRQTIACNYDHLDVHERLARLLLSEGKLTEAESEFGVHLSLHPDAIDSRLGLAYIKWALGDHTAAERVYREILERDDQHFVALSKLSRLYKDMGREGDMLEALDRVISSAARTSGIEHEVASLLFNCAQYDRATEWYERAVAADPTNAGLLNDLGNCHYKLGRYSSAVDSYRKALELPNSESISWRNLALTQAAIGEFAAAALSLETYVTAIPDNPDDLLILAELHRRANSHHSAISVFEKYLLSHPADPGAIFGLSESYLAMGHRDAAMVGYRRVLQLDPDSAPARCRIEELSGSPARP